MERRLWVYFRELVHFRNVGFNRNSYILWWWWRYQQGDLYISPRKTATKSEGFGFQSRLVCSSSQRNSFMLFQAILGLVVSVITLGQKLSRFLKNPKTLTRQLRCLPLNSVTGHIQLPNQVVIARKVSYLASNSRLQLNYNLHNFP